MVKIWGSQKLYSCFWLHQGSFPLTPTKGQGSTVLGSRQLLPILKPQSLVFLLLIDNFHFPSYADSKPQDDRGYILQLNVFWLTTNWPYRFLLEQTRRERRVQNLEYGSKGAATSSTEAVFLAVDASLVLQKRTVPASSGPGSFCGFSDSWTKHVCPAVWQGATASTGYASHLGQKQKHTGFHPLSWTTAYAVEIALFFLLPPSLHLPFLGFSLWHQAQRWQPCRLLSWLLGLLVVLQENWTR